MNTTVGCGYKLNGFKVELIGEKIVISKVELITTPNCSRGFNFEPVDSRVLNIYRISLIHVAICPQVLVSSLVVMGFSRNLQNVNSNVIRDREVPTAPPM